MWIIVGLAAILVVLCGAILLLMTNGRGRQGPIPTPTQISARTTGTSTHTIPSTTATAEQATPTSVAETGTPPSLTWTPTPGDTPLPATVTPISPTPTPTDTPEPPTHTPTPVPPTDTPTYTPSPTPTPVCATLPEGAFVTLWQSYFEQLGCPAYTAPKAIQDAEEAFQNGHMFWRADNDYAYVVYESGSRAGTYQAFTDLWSEGDPPYSCTASPPPGLVQPMRGFGAVWCLLGAESAPIGWALAEEGGFGPGRGDPLVQEFEKGFVFRDSDGTSRGLAYLFLLDGTFVRVPY
jgi:hypothetical protein